MLLSNVLFNKFTPGMPILICIFQLVKCIFCIKHHKYIYMANNSIIFRPTKFLMRIIRQFFNFEQCFTFLSKFHHVFDPFCNVSNDFWQFFPNLKKKSPIFHHFYKFFYDFDDVLCKIWKFSNLCNSLSKFHNILIIFFDIPNDFWYIFLRILQVFRWFLVFIHFIFNCNFKCK